MLKTMLKTKPIRFNRIIAMLLSLIMLCGILPFGALPLDVFAAELIDYEISIGGISITSNNIDRFESAENNRYGVAFDKSGNTLYLSAPDAMSVTNVDFISYFGKGTLTVVVLEDIRIECRGDSGFLHAESGSVVFSAESKGRLSITNGLTTAIKADKLTVEGGEISMDLTESGVYANTAIEANVISVNGGGLYVYGVPRDAEHVNVSDFHNTGIVYNLKMTVSGGVVVVDSYAYGIVAKDDKAVFNIKGGTVEVYAFRTGVKDGLLFHTAGALYAEGDEHGIFAAEIQVSGTAKLRAVNGWRYTNGYPVYAKGELKVDTDVFFIAYPEDGYVKDHPYGGKIIIDPVTNQPAFGMVEIMPRVSCFVRRNDGPEEEYPLTYSPENSGKFDLFQVRVGDKIVVRLVANDGQLLHSREPNGPQSVAQWYFLKTQRSDDKKQLTFTFEPPYLPKAAWTNNAHSYNKDEATAGCSVTLSPRDSNEPADQFSWLNFEALPGHSDWTVTAQVTIPRGETIRVRVPLKTYDGRDIAVSKEEFDNAYGLVRYTSTLWNDSYGFTHDGDSSVIAVMKVSDNAPLGTKAAMWDIIYSNSYDIHRFSLEATVVECWCDMGERLIERPVSEAACTVGGCAVKHWECSKCGKLFADADGNTQITDPQTVLTPAKGHKWVEKVDAGYLKSAADCENPAVYYKSCEYCGLSSKELYDLRAAAANFVPGSAETVTIDGVEFYILAVDDGKALLLTKETVAAGIAFDSDSPAWEGSDIQKWLNREWLDGKTRLAALLEPADIYTAAAYNDQKNTVASRDRVFLLSEADVTGEHDRKAVTNNALYTYNGAKLTAPGEGWGIDGRHWWLRSPCSAGIYVSAVTDRGMAHSYPHDLTVHYVQPRPAMWVRFDDPDPTPEWQYKIGKIVPGSADTVTIDGVEFHVLAKDAAKGEALLLTKNVLDDNRAFGGPGAEWINSDLRTWLNGEWLEGMPVLKNFVNETNIMTRGVLDDYRTQDKVFLLSAADVFSGGIEYTYNEAELPAPGGSWVAHKQDGTEAYWWLRSLHINNSGSNTDVVDHNANPLPLSSVMRSGVRPAVWVPYKEPEWQYQIGKIKPGSADTVTIDGVEFHVLAKDAAKGEALLLTKDVLYNKDFDLVFSHRNNPSWADSLLRDFMNGRQAETGGGSRFFYHPNNASTLAQYAQETEIYTPAGYDSSDLVMTRDTFFLLSEADVFGTQNGVAVTDPRYYTYKGKLPAPGGSWIAADVDGKPRYWWLRSPRYNQYSVAQVLDDGTLNSINPNAYDYDRIRGVRPAVWIQYKEPLPEPETFTHGDALGHDWGAASYDWSYTSNGTPSGCTASHTCKRCGHTETEDGTVTSSQTTDPTCTGEGQITYTATFTKPGFETQHAYSDVAMLKHSWGETVDAKYLKTAADCTNAAVYYKSCKTCGEKHNSETFEHGNPIGHKWVNTVDAKYLKSAADCDHPAVYFKSCERCDIAHDSEIFENGDALGHLFGKPAYSWETLRGSENRTCTAKRECERKGCDHFEEEKATVSVAKTTDPTCTEKGQYTYTAAFKNTAFETQKSYSDIAELGHEWVEKAEDQYLKTAADCTNAAVYHKSCSRCGEKHASETFESGNALGHDYDEWYVVTPATDRRKGLDRHDCKRDGCNHFETRDTDTVEYKTELEDTGNGKTTVEPADPQSGDGVKITVEPGEDSRVKEITVTDKDGKVIDVTDKGDGEYEFTMPESDVKIVVEYEPKPVVSVDENEGGKTKVEPEYPDAGDEVKITVEPEEDKRVKEITVTDKDGNKIDVTDKGNGGYVFTMPDSDVTIEVVYESIVKPSPENPPTGDNSKLLLWLMLMCISGIGVIATSLKGKKRKYNS